MRVTSAWEHRYIGHPFWSVLCALSLVSCFVRPAPRGSTETTGGRPESTAGATNAGAAGAEDLVRCNPRGMFAVGDGKYFVQNNVLPDTKSIQCITVDEVGFVITRAEHLAPTNEAPAAYPSIFVGCTDEQCTVKNPLPLVATDITALATDWVVGAQASGVYDVVYTLAFARQEDAGEANPPVVEYLKVWILDRGEIAPYGGPVEDAESVDINGSTWTVWYGESPQAFLTYLNTEQSGVSVHDLLPFVRDAMERTNPDDQLPYLDDELALTSVQAGFEIWEEGAGLKTLSFALDVETGVCTQETCNGLDDDCDGLTDFSLVDGEPVSACQLPCVPTRLTLASRDPALPDDEFAEALCAPDQLSCVDADGGATMSYCFDCGSGEGWFVCTFGYELDMTQFDLGYSGQGALAVEFCLAGTPMAGELSLWYGTHPDRRKISLKGSGEDLAAGCYTRLVAPVDACTPGYSDAVCKAKACGEPSASCPVPGLDRAPITLAAEGTCSAPSQGTVVLRSLTYFPPECVCVPGRVCPGDNATCSVGDGRGLPNPACTPGERCAGVCMPAALGCEDAEWQGLACEVQVNGQTCAGTLRCVNGSPLCDASGCVDAVSSSASP